MVPITLFLGRTTFSGLAVEMCLLIFQKLLKIVIFYNLCKIVQRYDFEIKQAILVFTIIIINISGNASTLGPHSVVLRFLADGYRKIRG